MHSCSHAIAAKYFFISHLSLSFSVLSSPSPLHLPKTILRSIQVVTRTLRQSWNILYFCLVSLLVVNLSLEKLENEQAGLTIWDVESVRHISTGKIWADWILLSKKAHEEIYICHRKLDGKDAVHHSVSLW